MKEIEKTIQTLRKIDFHNISVSKIEISTFPISRLVVYMDFADDVPPYRKTKELIFWEFENLNLKKLRLNGDSDLELNSFEFDYENEIFKCRLEFLLGFGQPTVTIQIDCLNIELIK